MKLPEKTFLSNHCKLYESDFEFNGNVKPHRIMQLLQDVATTHAVDLGMAWQVMDSNGLLWVLGKINMVFNKPITAQNSEFQLYTWPLAPDRFYAERCFTAVDSNGEQVFSATSLWMIISREQRKILPADTMNRFFHGEYSSVHADAPNSFVRVRKDETFDFVYEKQIRRSDLDRNGHVNNTNYILYALDVLPPEQKITQVQIVYNKELHFGDTVKIYSKRQQNQIAVVGESSETNFTALFTVE